MFNLSAQDRNDLVAFLQDLIRIPSLSTQEKAVAERLAEEMRRVGFSRVRRDRIGNVIGCLGAGAGPRLIYDGHMDTVGVSDLYSWARDPYGAQIEGGVLYGLGACDMKGALAAMVYGGKALVDAGIQLAGELCVVGVVQEEPCEGLAMQVLIEEEGIRPDFVVKNLTAEPHSAYKFLRKFGVNIFLYDLPCRQIYIQTPSVSVENHSVHLLKAK